MPRGPILVEGKAASIGEVTQVSDQPSLAVAAEVTADPFATTRDLERQSGLA